MNKNLGKISTILILAALTIICAISCKSKEEPATGFDEKYFGTWTAASSDTSSTSTSQFVISADGVTMDTQTYSKDKVTRNGENSYSLSITEETELTVNNKTVTVKSIIFDFNFTSETSGTYRAYANATVDGAEVNNLTIDEGTLTKVS